MQPARRVTPTLVLATAGAAFVVFQVVLWAANFILEVKTL